MSEWDRVLLELLASQYRLIIFDYCGIGDSTRDESNGSLSVLASYTYELVHSLGIKTAHILGYSMGTMVALDLYALHPDLVSSLILYGVAMSGKETADRISAYVDLTTPEVLSVHALLPEEWILSHLDLTKVFPRPAHKVNGPAILSQIDAMKEWQITPATLSTIRIPVMILAGSEDVITPLVTAKMVAHHIPGSSLVVFVGGGHAVMYQKPDRMARHIIEYEKKNRRE